MTINYWFGGPIDKKCLCYLTGEAEIETYWCPIHKKEEPDD